MQSGFFWGTGGALLGGSSLGLPLKLMRSDNWILSVHHLLQHRRRRRRSTAPTCTCFLTSWLRVTPSRRQILFICVLMAPGEMRVLAILCTETATDQTLPPFIWTEPVIKDETKAVSFLSSLQERHPELTLVRSEHEAASSGWVILASTQPKTALPLLQERKQHSCFALLF